MASAWSNVRNVNTPGRSAPGTGSERALLPVAEQESPEAPSTSVPGEHLARAEVDRLDRRLELELDAIGGPRVGGLDAHGVARRAPAQVVLGERRPLVGWLGFIGEHHDPPVEAFLAQVDRRPSSAKTSPHDDDRPLGQCRLRCRLVVRCRHRTGTGYAVAVADMDRGHGLHSRPAARPGSAPTPNGDACPRCRWDPANRRPPHHGRPSRRPSLARFPPLEALEPLRLPARPRSVALLHAVVRPVQRRRVSNATSWQEGATCFDRSTGASARSPSP